jgi:acetolactate decarboxylase
MGYKSRICIVIAICFVAGLLAGCVSAPPPDDQDQDDVLTQVSTIDAILNGLYDGVITYRDLKEHGDFGIGTFEGLDGEMVALDGNFY